MTAFRLAANEIRRLTASRIGRLALVALTLIPAIYAGLYLYANKDPYGGFSRVPAAVVVEDTGTTLATGERLDAGGTVERDLLASGSFEWRVLDRAQAQEQVRSGDVDFALVVPPAFSADLASSAQFTPRQAQLELLTNDANNYTAHTIANQVVAQVTKSVAAQVSTTAANQLLTGFTQIHDKTAQAVDGAARLQSGLTQAKGGADQLASGSAALVVGQQKLADGSQQLAAGAGTLSSGLNTLDTATQSLPSKAAQLASGAKQVSDGNAKIGAVGTEVATAATQAHDALTTDRAALVGRLQAAGLTPPQIDTVNAELDRLAVPIDAANTTIQQTSGQLTQLASGSKQVADGAAALGAAAGPLHDGVHQAAGGAGTLSTGATQLHDGATQALSGVTQLADGAAKLDTATGQLSDGATQLQDGLASGLTQIPDPSPEQRTAVAQTLGSPVTVANVSQASAGDYGGGLAPFFLSLSLWIGAYILFLLVKPFSSRALATNQLPLRVALGGWMAPALVGLAQVLVVFAIVAGVLRIDVAHPLGTIALMCYVSMTFVAILHVLAARFGTVGKFLGLVFMVIQLVSAGGTFPWQTLPEPLHPVHSLVPMSYAIDGVRRLMYGADLGPLGLDLAVLTAYLVGAIVLASLSARWARMWTAARLKPELTL